MGNSASKNNKKSFLWKQEKSTKFNFPHESPQECLFFSDPVASKNNVFLMNRESFLVFNENLVTWSIFSALKWLHDAFHEPIHFNLTNFTFDILCFHLLFFHFSVWEFEMTFPFYFPCSSWHGVNWKLYLTFSDC